MILASVFLRGITRSVFRKNSSDLIKKGKKNFFRRLQLRRSSARSSFSSSPLFRRLCLCTYIYMFFIFFSIRTCRGNSFVTVGKWRVCRFPILPESIEKAPLPKRIWFRTADRPRVIYNTSYRKRTFPEWSVRIEMISITFFFTFHDIVFIFSRNICLYVRYYYFSNVFCPDTIWYK